MIVIPTAGQRRLGLTMPARNPAHVVRPSRRCDSNAPNTPLN